MTGRAIGKRYAKALLSLAKEKNKMESILDGLRLVSETFEESSELRGVLSDPHIAKDSKAKIITALCERLKVDSLVDTFSRYLVFKNRFLIICEIYLSFQKQLYDIFQKQEVEVVLSKEINQQKIESLKKEISAFIKKEVILSVKVDPYILGGAITRLGVLFSMVVFVINFIFSIKTFYKGKFNEN